MKTLPRARSRAVRGSLRAASRAALLLLALAAAGCSILGSGSKDTATIFAIDPRVQPDPAWPTVEWQLTLGQPSSSRFIDSLRISVRPTPAELQVYKGASWSKTPTDMVQDVLLRTLEDSGRIGAVARQGAGINADYKLIVDMRRFEADYAGQATPSATIEFNAKLVHAADQDVVASRTFLHAEPAGSTEVAAVADAFSRGLQVLGGEAAGWILTTGASHDRSVHPLTNAKKGR